MTHLRTLALFNDKLKACHFLTSALNVCHVFTAANLFAELSDSVASGAMTHELAVAWISSETPRRRAAMLRIAAETNSDFARTVLHDCR